MIKRSREHSAEGKGMLRQARRGEQAQHKFCKLKECGKKFIPYKNGAKREYCSTECGRKQNLINAEMTNKKIASKIEEHTETIKLKSGVEVLNNVLGQFMARGDGGKEYYKEK